MWKKDRGRVALADMITGRDQLIFDYETSSVCDQTGQILTGCFIKTDDRFCYRDSDITEISIRDRRDVIHSPGAFLVHQVDLNALEEDPKSLTEFEAALVQRNLLCSPGSNLNFGGYNTNIFDEGQLRNSFFRNLIDPYRYFHPSVGNVRFDVYGMILMAHTLKPDIISWPEKEDGRVSLKLEDLVRENGLSMGRSHDATIDVMETVALLKLLAEQSPTLVNYCVNLGAKGFVDKVINAARDEDRNLQPLVHCSSVYGADKGYASIVLPLGGGRYRDPVMSAKRPVIDLTKDVRETLEMSPDELAHRFTKKVNLPPGFPDIAVNDLATNKMIGSVVVSAHGYLPIIEERGLIDLDVVNKNLEYIRGPGKLKISKFLDSLNKSGEGRDWAPPKDAYETIYTGSPHREGSSFLSDAEKKILNTLISPLGKKAGYLIAEAPLFKVIKSIHEKDRLRMFDLMLRVKFLSFEAELFRNTDRLSYFELDEYINYLEEIYFSGKYSKGMTVEDQKLEIDEIMANYHRPLTDQDRSIIKSVEINTERKIELLSEFKAVRDRLEYKKEAELKDYGDMVSWVQGERVAWRAVVDNYQQMECGEEEGPSP